MDEQLPWLVIDKYFKDNPYSFVSHHLDSYNDFFNDGIKQISKKLNLLKYETARSENKRVSL